METQHTETVVEKVTSYVKDMLGIPQDDHQPDVEAKPEYSDIAPALHFADEPPELTTKDAMHIEPHVDPEPGLYPLKSDARGVYPEPEIFPQKTAAEINAESARREDGAEF